MEVRNIKRRFDRQQKENVRDWNVDPQKPDTNILKIINTTKHNEELLKLRKYPKHPPTFIDLKDDNDSLCIEFLSEEVLYSFLSLKKN